MKTYIEFDMPENCCVCRLYSYDNISCTPFCGEIGELDYQATSRPADCPLQEAPENKPPAWIPVTERPEIGRSILVLIVSIHAHRLDRGRQRERISKRPQVSFQSTPTD